MSEWKQIAEYGSRKNTHKKHVTCSEFIPLYAKTCPICEPQEMHDWTKK